MAQVRNHASARHGKLLCIILLSLGALLRGMVAAQRRCRRLARGIPPPPPPSPLGPGEDVPAVPRVLSFIVMNRDAPKIRDHYGHWWIEIDGLESYGWWADHCPFRVRDMIIGTRGVLNGVGGTCRGGTPTTDPRHGDEPDQYFFPILTVPKSDRQVREDIRAFARSHHGAWGWQWWWSRERMTHCHTFQDDLFRAVGLREPAEYIYTRGPGCPFMYPWRRLAWKLQDTTASIQEWLATATRRVTRQRPAIPIASRMVNPCQPCETGKRHRGAQSCDGDHATRAKLTADVLAGRDAQEVGAGS